MLPRIPPKKRPVFGPLTSTGYAARHEPQAHSARLPNHPLRPAVHGVRALRPRLRAAGDRRPHLLCPVLAPRHARFLALRAGGAAGVPGGPADPRGADRAARVHGPARRVGDGARALAGASSRRRPALVGRPFAFRLFSGPACRYGRSVQQTQNNEGSRRLSTALTQPFVLGGGFPRFEGPGMRPGLCAYRSTEPSKTQRPPRPPRMRPNEPRRRGGHRQR